jgi:hypothetical protein
MPPTSLTTIDPMTKKKVTVAITGEIRDIVKNATSYPVPITTMIGDRALTMFVDANLVVRGVQHSLLPSYPASTDVLDAYCDGTGIATDAGMMKLLDKGCLMDDATRSLDSARLKTRKSVHEIGRDLKRIADLAKKVGKDDASFVMDRIEKARNLLETTGALISSMGRELAAANDFARSDIEGLTASGLEAFRDVLAMKDARRSVALNERCPDRPVVVLREMCKEKGLAGCHAFNKAQLVKALCKA